MIAFLPASNRIAAGSEPFINDGETMRKRFWFVILIGTLLLVSCQANQNQGSGNPTATADAYSAPTPAPETAPATDAGLSNVQEPAQPAQCHPMGISPTPNPTEQSLAPAPTDQDHTQGPKDAYVTITEYSDFM
jgi:hypothetical protein